MYLCAYCKKINNPQFGYNNNKDLAVILETFRKLKKLDLILKQLKQFKCKVIENPKLQGYNKMENRVRSPNCHFSFSKTTVSSPRSSILQNLTNITNTANGSGNPFKRSIISTSKSKNENRDSSVEKSKIKTLPNYQRYSMGNSLPYVTIFQTIEIQRLSDQIQTQRIKIKQYQRQIFNTQSFQVQIRQLSERCTLYEGQIHQYRQQLDKMNKICQTLYHENQSIKNRLKNTDSSFKAKLQQQTKANKQLSGEIERWMTKYSLSQQNKQYEREKMKEMMEKQRKSMIDREMKDLQVRHQSQVAKLNVQVRRLNQLLDIKQRDIQEIKRKHQNSQDYIKQLKDYGLKLNEYQQKICLLSEQHLRLSQIIDINTTQLDNARKKQFILNKQLKTDKQLILDNEYLREIIQMKQKQLQNWKYSIMQLQQQVLKGKQYAHKNQQLMIRVQCLTNQNEKILKLLKDRSAEIERWKKTVLSMQQDNKRCRENESYAMQRQSKISILKAQNQRLEGINKLKQRELDEIRAKHVVAREQLTIMNQLEKEKKNIQQKYKAQILRTSQLQEYVQILQQQSNRMKQSDHKLKSYQSMMQSLKKQNQRLHLRIDQNERQLTNMKQFQAEIGKQYVKLKQTDNIVMQYQSKIAVFNQEVQRLNQMIKIKNSQIVQLQDERIANFTIVSQCKGLQTQIQEKQRVINKIRSQLDTSKTKISKYQQKMQEFDTKNNQLFSNLSQKIRTLQEQNRKKTKQCQQYKYKQSRLLKQREEIGQIQRMSQKQQSRISGYLQDIDNLRAQNKQYQAILSQEKRKVQELQNQMKKTRLSVIEQQNSSFISKSQSSRKSTQSNKSAFPSLSSNSNIEPEKLISKINSLQMTLNELKNKYEQLLKFAKGSHTNTNNSSSSNKSIIFCNSISSQ